MREEVAAKPFGDFRPGGFACWFLRGLVRVGLGRGAVKKWIVKEWRRRQPVVDVAVRGVKYRLDLNSNVTDCKILSSSKVYDGAELAHLARAAAGRADAVFVDVGANTGYYSLCLARRGYARVVAIEPNPPTMERLRFNVSINGLDERIAAVQSCIGEGGEVPFYFSGDMGSASVFANGRAEAARCVVQSRPLLDVLRGEGVSHVEGLKIDVEGFEDKCLLPFFAAAPRGLWPRVVVLEFCNRRLWGEDVIERMLELGYAEARRCRGNVVLELRGG